MKKYLLLLLSLALYSTASFAEQSPLTGTPSYDETMSWIATKLNSNPAKIDGTAWSTYLEYNGCDLTLSKFIASPQSSYRETYVFSLRNIDPDQLDVRPFKGGSFAIGLFTLDYANVISVFTQFSDGSASSENSHNLVVYVNNGEVNLSARMLKAIKHAKELCPFQSTPETF